MSGLGAAFAGLVNGFVAGKDVRNKWDDRKDEKARTKRADEIRDAAEKRAQERHELSLTTSGLMNDARRQALRVGDQEWQDFSSTRSAADEAVRAAEEGMIAGPAMGALPTGPAPVPENTAAAPALSFGASAGGRSLFSGPSAGLSFAATTPAAAPVAAPAPAPVRAMDAPPTPLSYGATPSPISQHPHAALSFPAAAPVDEDAAPATGAGAALPFRMGSPPSALDTFTAEELAVLQGGGSTQRPVANYDRAKNGPLLQQGEDGKFYSQRPPADEVEKKQIADLARSGNLGIDADKAAAQARLDAVKGPAHEWGADGNAANDIARAAGQVGAVGAGLAEGAVNLGVDALNIVTEPGRRVRRWIHGANPEDGRYNRVDLNDNGSTGTLISPALDALRPVPETPENAKKAYDDAIAPPPKNGKPPAEGEKAVAAGATAAMDQVGSSPDMQAAAQNVPAQSFGARPGRQLTPKQTERGAKDFMTSWRENGAPIIMKELMRQGKIEEAQQLDTWVKSAEAQKGMELWAKGQFQAQMGDIMGAYDTWVDAFNEAGYYEDGYEIVKDESEVLTDRSGNPVGVSLTFRDQGTGQTHTKTMSPEDMGMAFGLMLSPVEAFKASQERQKALQDQLIEAEKERAKTAQELIVKDYEGTSKAISDAAKAIFEGSMGQVTYQEALRQAQEAHSGTAAGVPDAEVPVLARPRQ